jgi:HrpA-like RNA helicase
MLKAIGIKNIYRFPFPTKPESQHLLSAVENLKKIGALIRDEDYVEEIDENADYDEN